MSLPYQAMNPKPRKPESAGGGWTRCDKSLLSIQGGPPPDNPVPAADGSHYSPSDDGWHTRPRRPPAAAGGKRAPQPPSAPAPEDLFTTENGGDYGAPVENGHSGPVRPERSLRKPL